MDRGYEKVFHEQEEDTIVIYLPGVNFLLNQLPIEVPLHRFQALVPFLVTLEKTQCPYQMPLEVLELMTSELYIWLTLSRATYEIIGLSSAVQEAMTAPESSDDEKYLEKV